MSEYQKYIHLMKEPPIVDGDGSDSYVYFHLNTKETNYINRILEGYEYVGVMTTLNHDGDCMIRCTPSTRELAIEILSSLEDKVQLDNYRRN
mgnify:CR=1 FL=1